MRRPPNRKLVIYLFIILLSSLYIFMGNAIATNGLTYQSSSTDGYYVKSEVTQILEVIPIEDELGDNDGENIRFEAEIVSGANKGKFITAVKTYDTFVDTEKNSLEVGEKVILFSTELTIEQDWIFLAYARSDVLIIFGLVFIGALLLFGQMKGFHTIVSLTYTCLAIFAVLIPAIINGQNIYLWSIVTCTFITVMTLVLISEADKKSISAIFGCLGGVFLAGLLTIIMDGFLHMTGVVSEESVYLLSLSSEIDLKAVMFGAILIGAIGAIMDVAMSISSSLFELSEQIAMPTFGSLFKSGMTIGKDIMGTMANTLILAYIGSSLALILLLVAYNTPLLYLFNRELIVVEVLQALVGSFGLLFAIPFTSLVSAKVYTMQTTSKKRRRRRK